MSTLLPPRTLLRAALGLVAWCVAAFAVGGLLLEERGGGGGSALAKIGRYLVEESGTIVISFPEQVLLEVGDEVRIAGPAGEETVGEVDSLLAEDGQPLEVLWQWCSRARVRLHDFRGADLRADATARLVRVPQTASWVFQTMLTEENLPLLAAEWNQAMLEYREEIFEILTPIIRDVALDIERHVESEFPTFAKRHRPEIDLLAEDVRRDFLRDEFTRFFERDFWPIARARLEPLAREVGKEIWERFPLWGFSWRVAYQVLPFTAGDHVEAAWRRFLQNEAMPLLLAHAEEATQALKEVSREVIARPEVSATLRLAFENVLASRRFQDLSRTFLREVILDHPKLQETLRERWRSPRVRRALEFATRTFEPVVRRMGDILLGTRESGISPEFARVLRAQILLKDLNRLVLRRGGIDSPAFDPSRPLAATLEWDIRDLPTWRKP